MKGLLSAVVGTVLLACGVSAQQFGAVPRAKHLQRRDVAGLRPRRDDLSLYFVPGDQDASLTDAVVAKVSLEPIMPMILLDETEDLQDVQCSPDGIILSFGHEEHFHHARRSMAEEEQIAIITTKAGCAEAGVHQAYIVHAAHYRESDLTVRLNATRSTLRDCSREMYAEFGSHLAEDVDASRIVKRQSSDSVVPVETGSINFAYADTQLIPPSPIIATLLQGFGFPDGVEVSCQNCTATGLLSLTAGGFSIHSGDIDTLTDFVMNGHIDFTVQNMHAYVDMLLNVVGSATPIEFTPELPPIPVVGISIPHVTTFGLVMDVTFPMTFSVLEQVNVNTGFQLDVPDNSLIRVGVGDDAQSRTVGFTNSQLTPKPIMVDRSDLAFAFTAAFQPQLNLVTMAGTPTGGFDLNGQLGVFMDLPMLNVTLEPVSNVDSNCNPVAPGSAGVDKALEIIPSIVLDAGYRWEIEFTDPLLPNFNLDREVPVLAQSFPLPNQCLVFDGNGSPAPPPAASSWSAPTSAPTPITDYTSENADGYEKMPGKAGVGVDAGPGSKYIPCDPIYHDDGTIEYCDNWTPS